jgi:NADPH-ferrihemoprotein reductase
MTFLGLTVGWTDIVIIAALGAGAAYYYLVYSRQPSPGFSHEIKPLNPMEGGYRADDSSFVKKMQSSGRNVVVFYGSQTGTAEELAGRLAKDAARYGMKGIALDPEECEMDELAQLSEIENPLAIFCMATYGEGDPTDNAQEFHEFLQRGEADLTGINYAVFGLGNKTYEHFNSMGKFTDGRLTELGAKRVHELGLGDDDGNLEEDFMLWREGFWPSVCDFFDIQAVAEDINTRQYQLTVHAPEDVDHERTFTGEVARLRSFERQKPPFDQKNPFLAEMRMNKELHKGGERSCRHIEFNIADSRLRYEAGDHAAVYPVNDLTIVEKIGKILNVDLDTVITLTNVDEDSSKKHPFPCPCSYRTALSHYVDIVTPPRTHVLKELADYCSNPEEKEFLRSMTSAKEESRKIYSDWILASHRAILDILQDMPSCKPPLDHVLELLPRLQARYYSISSSPKPDPAVLAITAVVVKYETKIGRTVKGVATNYLKEKVVDEEHHPKVPIFIRKSQLRLPHRPNTPVLMLGPGTGFAPFRGFLQDRHQLKKEGKPIGPMVLYFGCRHKAEDYIYQEEIEGWLADGTLSQANIAFSRDQDHKVYVQHLLKKHGEETWKLLEDGGHIYVCGDARNMAHQVHQTFVEIAMEFGGMGEEEARNFVKRLESQKRYQADVWS